MQLDQLETLVAFFTVGLQFSATVKMREYVYQSSTRINKGNHRCVILQRK